MRNTNEMELCFDSVSANEGFARVAVAAFLTQLNPTVEEVADVKTAVSEAVTNAIIHGYENYDGYSNNRTPFYGCTSLKEITVDEGVTSIPKYAFRNMTSLETINLPESLTTISAYAFDGCTALKSIELPEALSSIENYAFRGCSGIKEITVPEKVTVCK